MPLKVGDIVRLHQGKCKAKVAALVENVPGGVLLDQYLAGFRYWNEDELKKCRPPDKRRMKKEKGEP